jgi:rare lipoprotein A
LAQPWGRVTVSAEVSMLRATAAALCVNLVIGADNARCASVAGATQAQTGRASVYSPSFAGRRTASGERFRLASDAAASNTLPLGTTARVTDLRTGRSAIVRIRDRGPHVRGRIIDLSPATARALGMRNRGVETVSVVPISPARR